MCVNIIIHYLCCPGDPEIITCLIGNLPSPVLLDHIWTLIGIIILQA